VKGTKQTKPGSWFSFSVSKASLFLTAAYVQGKINIADSFNYIKRKIESNF